jgi:hypothetical protein
MKPGDHPDFFRRPPPGGRSRESTIVLDRHGRFFHDGEPFEHKGLAGGFHKWISRHPDNGRFILSNGYDWTYFEVEDTAFFVTALHIDGNTVTVTLSDGTTEPLDPTTVSIDGDDVLRVAVKGGSYEARFQRSAQLAIAGVLCDDEPLALMIAGERHPIKSS